MLVLNCLIFINAAISQFRRKGAFQSGKESKGSPAFHHQLKLRGDRGKQNSSWDPGGWSREGTYCCLWYQYENLYERINSDDHFRQFWSSLDGFLYSERAWIFDSEFASIAKRDKSLGGKISQRSESESYSLETGSKFQQWFVAVVGNKLWSYLDLLKNLNRQYRGELFQAFGLWNFWYFDAFFEELFIGFVLKWEYLRKRGL